MFVCSRKFSSKILIIRRKSFLCQNDVCHTLNYVMQQTQCLNYRFKKTFRRDASKTPTIQLPTKAAQKKHQVKQIEEEAAR